MGRQTGQRQERHVPNHDKSKGKGRQAASAANDGDLDEVVSCDPAGLRSLITGDKSSIVL
jgi:hypothetical protein